MSQRDGYENAVSQMWRHVRRNTTDAALAVSAVLVAAYYYSASWFHNQGMLGDAPMMFVNVVTLATGLILAANAVVMIRDGLTANQSAPSDGIGEGPHVVECPHCGDTWTDPDDGEVDRICEECGRSFHG